MTSLPIRDQANDHLLTPLNYALIVLDYQPVPDALRTATRLVAESDLGAIRRDPLRSRRALADAPTTSSAMPATSWTADSRCSRFSLSLYRAIRD
jgi:hypothetical protein